MKRQIMVVDDEIGALTLIGIMLERGGFDVLKARDAQQALGVLDEYTPDLIILDVMMNCVGLFVSVMLYGEHPS